MAKLKLLFLPSSSTRNWGYAVTPALKATDLYSSKKYDTEVSMPSPMPTEDVIIPVSAVMAGPRDTFRENLSVISAPMPRPIIEPKNSVSSFS